LAGGRATCDCRQGDQFNIYETVSGIWLYVESGDER